MDVLLVIQILVVLLLVGSILLQRSSQDGFVSGGGGGDAFMSRRGSADFMTRTTAILAAIFLANSLVLAYLSSHAMRGESMIDKMFEEEGAVPAAPVEAKKPEPKQASKPLSVPVAE